LFSGGKKIAVSADINDAGEKKKTDYNASGTGAFGGARERMVSRYD